MSKWSRDATVKLIYELQNHECLYNSNSALYSNRSKRSTALKKIYELLQKEFNEEAILKKIRCLRLQYLREVRAIKKHKKCGIGTDEVYQPKLWCYKELHFFKNVAITRPTTFNIQLDRIKNHIPKRQKIVLLQLMKENTDQYCGLRKKVNSGELWQRISESLNANEEEKKSPEQWKRIWTDWKSSVKRQYLIANQSDSSQNGSPRSIKGIDKELVEHFLMDTNDDTIIKSEDEFSTEMVTESFEEYMVSPNHIMVENETTVNEDEPQTRLETLISSQTNILLEILGEMYKMNDNLQLLIEKKSK